MPREILAMRPSRRISSYLVVSRRISSYLVVSRRISHYLAIRLLGVPPRPTYGNSGLPGGPCLLAASSTCLRPSRTVGRAEKQRCTDGSSGNNYDPSRSLDVVMSPSWWANRPLRRPSASKARVAHERAKLWLTSQVAGHAPLCTSGAAHLLRPFPCRAVVRLLNGPLLLEQQAEVIIREGILAWRTGDVRGCMIT